jgi:hypothetical protein
MVSKNSKARAPPRLSPATHVSNVTADTLIVWTDNGVDMALSFQEAEGCAAIWFVEPAKGPGLCLYSNGISAGNSSTGSNVPSV